MYLDNSVRTACLEALRAVVDERGIEMPAETRKMRRKRTVIFSTNSGEALKLADKIVSVADQTARYTENDEELQRAAAAA
jgi:hypothetical protein